jgi:hypothetical protein
MAQVIGEALDSNPHTAKIILKYMGYPGGLRCFRVTESLGGMVQVICEALV